MRSWMEVVWWKAPLRPRHHPGAAGAVEAPGLLLAMSGAAAPLFLSSAANASLAGQFASTCSWAPTRALSVALVGPITGSFEQVVSSSGRVGSPEYREVRRRVPAARLAARRQAAYVVCLSRSFARSLSRPVLPCRVCSWMVS